FFYILIDILSSRFQHFILFFCVSETSPNFISCIWFNFFRSFHRLWFRFSSSKIICFYNTANRSNPRQLLYYCLFPCHVLIWIRNMVHILNFSVFFFIGVTFYTHTAQLSAFFTVEIVHPATCSFWIFIFTCNNEVSCIPY